MRKICRVCKPTGYGGLPYSAARTWHNVGGKAEPYGKYGTVKIQDKFRENTKTKYKTKKTRARRARVEQPINALHSSTRQCGLAARPGASK
jgi:hypothetical protein